MQKFFAIGNNGRILAFNTLEGLKGRDVHREHGEHALLSPLVEMPLREFPSTIFWCPSSHGIIVPSIHARDFVQSAYRDPSVYGPKRYGAFGDVLSITVLDELARDGAVPMVLDFIAPKAFPKPALAADLVVFVYSEKDQELYFVGLTRRHEPGKGFPATFGGFLDVQGYHLESPLEAALREGREEADIRLSLRGDLPITEEMLLSEKVHYVRALLPKSADCFSAELKYVGVVPTSALDELPSGQKRVYWAFGYALLVRMPSLSLSEASLAALFSESEEGSLYVKKLSTSVLEIPPFASEHHEVLFVRAHGEALSWLQWRT